MLRITRETDYGILLMTYMAEHQGQAYSANLLAEQQKLPVPMVSKILKLLSKKGLLVSQRGARGGYCLALTPDEITVADIIGALEGPIAITECNHEDQGCAHQPRCTLTGHWHRINSAIHTALNNISLQDLRQPVSTHPIRMMANPLQFPPVESI